MFTALVERNYRTYLAGSFVSNIGTWMQRVAQDWLVLELSGGSASRSASPRACSSCRCSCCPPMRG